MRMELLLKTPDWAQLPLLMRLREVTSLYGVDPTAFRRKVERGDSDVPQPNFLRPMRRRRDDVRRHYEALGLPLTDQDGKGWLAEPPWTVRMLALRTG